MKLLTKAIFTSGLLICHSVHGFIGTSYVDIGDQSRDDFCKQITNVYQQYSNISNKPAKCIWLEPEQGWGTYHQIEQTTIQLRLIHGTAYEIGYDLPASADKYDFSSFLARNGKQLLSDIGVTSGGYSGSIAAARKAKEADIEVRRNASKPKCMKIRFTGYAAIYPQNLLSVQRSKHPNELIADHPIVCNDSEWGGHYLDNGAVINRNYMTECKGVGYFRNQLADIDDWKDDSYHVSSLVQFNTGRRRLPLYIWKKDATCVK